MAGFMTQFHATREEIGDFIEQWMLEHPVVLSAFAFPPATRVPISPETLRQVLSRVDVDEVTFTMGPVDPHITSGYDVAAAKLGPLHLNIGRLTPRGLEQSALSTIDPNPLWQKLNKELKKKTKAGADYHHEENGARGYERNFRFSPGAKALAESGISLRQFSQAATIFLPK